METKCRNNSYRRKRKDRTLINMTEVIEVDVDEILSLLRELTEEDTNKLIQILKEREKLNENNSHS